MTNEDKSKELAIEFTKDIDENGKEIYNVMCEAALQEMAAWKDEQIERMKCCYNCGLWCDGSCSLSPNAPAYYDADFVCGNWTMKGGEE